MSIDISYTGTQQDSKISVIRPSTYILDYPCSSTTTCYPYNLSLTRGQYLFELYGGSGDSSDQNFSYGGYSSGILNVQKSHQFFVYIGSHGVLNGDSSYNGGGKGSATGFSGGGATDVRLISGSYNNFQSLLSRIIVAGGGGGYDQHTTTIGNYGDYAQGGGIIGGRGFTTLNGSPPVSLSPSEGGSQTTGGRSSYCTSGYCRSHPTSAVDGSFGIGGNSSDQNYGAGGGGGYFGGGSGISENYIVGSGAGGSSYVSGHDNCIAMSKSSTSTNLIPLSTSIHYSGIRFHCISIFPKVILPNSFNFPPKHIGNGQFKITILCNQCNCVSKYHFPFYIPLYLTHIFILLIC